MNCKENRERTIDMLYGEEGDSRRCFEFFKHLEGCQECEQEYLELIRTREILGEWESEEAHATDHLTGSGRVLSFVKPFWRLPWWPTVQKVAAGFLIGVGGLFLLQYMGYWGGQTVSVSQQQLSEMVQDMIVARQAEERHVISALLVGFREDIDLQREEDTQHVYNYLVGLEQQYLENQEENNQYLKAILTR